jgi:CheY-like chemotaxis protein/DNA helicase HerA-like ATPase
MEQNSRNILFIDDHSEQYLSTLEMAAKAAGFNLFSADNVLEGLDFLEDYATAVDAVILDLGFPKGEMQGTDALQKIKKKFAHLPVIMLTDSDTAADLERVVDCMKRGAYNYVGKKTLNPVYLFQLVDNALQQSQLVSYTKAANKPANATEAFFTVTQEYGYGRFRKRALFGFDLSSVSKPNDEKDELQLKTNALAWHENLLKSVSTPFRDSVQINLKYIADSGSLKCRIIFSVLGEDDEKLQQRIADTQHDVKAFFSGGNRDKSNPYLFENISDEEVLKNAVEFSSGYKYNLFFRSPLKVKTGGSGAIGFNTAQHKEDGPKILGKIPLYQPDEVFSIPTELAFDNELFRALSVQQHYTEIDVQLMPKSLMMEEVDLLRQVAKNPSLLQNSQYNQKEIEWFADYLNKFISTTNDKFLISVLLKRKGGQVQQHVKTAVQKYFFGNAPVQSDFREADKLMRFKTDAEDSINQLPFFYSLNQAIQAFRLPLPDSKAPEGIASQPVSFTQMPKNLSANGILLGEKKTVNGTSPIRISEEALARHLYIMGQTGTGKSTLLKTMIADCLQKNYGFALIDPHGDLFDEVQKLIPKAKSNKLVVLNTTDPENSAKHNPIGYDEDNPQSKSLVINELIRIFGSLYDMRQAGGPMFELYLKNGLLLVMDEKVQEKYKHATLLDFVNVFFDDNYRKELISLCGNKKVADFFNVAVKNSGDWSFSNFATYITSKLTRFTDDYYLTPIISSKKGNINFRKLIDDGNILLVKMDKGLIGSDNVSLLGQMLVSSIVLAAMSRANMGKTERKPFYLFIDEFQNFIKGDVGSALSEVRKYGLSLTLANQTLGQLEQSMVEALMGNVGSMIFFRPGINDYEKVRHYLEPEFSREDVLKLPNFNCISRLLIDNIPCEPFVFQNKYE